MSKKILLYVTENYVQYCRITHNGTDYLKKNIYICICMCVCVCIYRESHFAIQQKLILQINYISMKIIKTEKKCKKKAGVVWSLLTDVLERENTKP